jgi:hypothetical protein
MRLDSEGRDVTHMPGLHDESDVVLYEPITDLGAAVVSTLGGVGACSREHYQAALQQIARMCHREIDDAFRAEVRSILESMPCPLD